MIKQLYETLSTIKIKKVLSLFYYFFITFSMVVFLLNVYYVVMKNVDDIFALILSTIGFVYLLLSFIYNDVKKMGRD